MHHLCGKPEKKNIEFYSPNDMTLGAYLRKTASEALDKCEFCREKMFKHVTGVYHGEGYIEISVSIKGNRYLYNKLNENEYDKNSKAKENNLNRIKDLISIDASDLIIMYEECKKCKSLVIEKKTINSDLQEYSFTKFIEQYFNNPDIVVQHTEDPADEAHHLESSFSSDSVGNHSQGS